MRTTFLSLVCMSALTFSCSSDNDESGNDGTQDNTGINQPTATGDFFPLAENNEWNYNVISTNNNDNSSADFTDNLVVDSENGTNYTLSANNGAIANGTMTNFLVSGDLSATETQLTSTGSFVIPIDGVSTIEIPFSNAKFYDTAANINEVIFNTNGNLNQDIESIPIDITYTLKTTQLENLDSYSVDGTSYENVTSSRISIELGMSTTIDIGPISQTLSIIDEQNVLTITSYYADGVGLILANANTSFELNQSTLDLLAQGGVDISELPTSVDIDNDQVLDSYTVN